MKQYSVILIGAGMRGTTYTNEMLNAKDKFKVVGVAEPVEIRRNYIKSAHNLSDEMCYNSWEDILSQPKMADFAIISTMDDMHYEPAMKAIELGYNLLLEKPVAPTAKECADIALAAEKKGVKVLVCHVLRYTNFFKKIKNIIMDGTLGNVMSIMHVEAVGNIHQSHSYVRGNWHSEKETSPMLLAKCCHDLDILQWLLDEPCEKIQSFGKLTYFTEANAPKGAPVRCIDGGCPIEDTCPYNCRKLYYDDKENSWFRYSSTRDIVKGDNITDEDVMTALKTTDYGLCVYHANNDVVDHQTVNMQFKSGANVTLTMNAFNQGGRFIRIFGTKGELTAYMESDKIEIYTFDDGKRKEVATTLTEESILGGHGGGDTGLVYELYDYFSGNYNGYCAADINISVKNHLIGFAAEKSRREDTVENIDKFFAEYGFTNN
ncbi:MAG: Gfo/Idh/MocA family oxidoreductase [Ruminococcaceae bacterium]|nr:Gfo/Idh/MocA family oxidoreductase [Oscillospiraceae bacterium]